MEYVKQTVENINIKRRTKMNKKFITVAVILCLLSLGSYAFGTSAMDTEILAWHAYQDDWVGNSNGGTTTDWNDPCNWALVAHASEGPGTIFPIDSRVWACIEPKTPGPNVTGDINCVRLSIHPWSWEYAPAPFVMTISETAGEVNCGVMIGLADKAYFVSPTWGYPQLDVNGGHIFTPGMPNVTDWFTNPPTIDPVKPWWDGEGLWVGGSCPSAGGGVGNGTGAYYGIVNVNGGMIDVPAIKLYYGDINVYGGLVYHNVSDTSSFFISQSRAMNKINVAGGELRLKGDRMDQVLYYLSKGRLIPCDGHGDLHIDFNGTDTSVTATCTPDSAWNPNPIDGAISVPLNKTLTWSAGPSTLTAGDNNAHDVYFGTDFSRC